MVYYAKSVNKQGHQTTVKEHLSDVSEHAAEYATKLGLESEGRLVGLMHDLGKYSQAFQDVLAGKTTKIDHAFPGAVICKSLPSYISETIAGHHHGLMSKDDLKSYFTDLGSILPTGRVSSLQSKNDLLDAFCKLQEEFGTKYVNDLVNCVKERRKSCNTNDMYGLFENMLETRMLFSCLVDADYSSSAYEETGDLSVFAENDLLDSNGCLSALKDIRNKAAGKPYPDVTKHMRNIVWDDCGKAGLDVRYRFLELTAPTGSGKTFGFLNFALNRIKSDASMKRIIIALPFLSLTDQVADIACQVIPGTIVDTSMMEFNDGNKDIAERWSAPCVVTTTVQLFQSLFSDKPGDCRKLHRLSGAIIILDEVQALPDSLASICVRTLKKLVDDYNVTVLMSTATPPSYDKIANLDYGAAQVICNVSKLFDIAPAEGIHVMPGKYALGNIADMALKQDNSCVITNLKKHALEVYNHWKERGTKNIYLLSTDLCPANRKWIISDIKALQDAGEPVHVSATQCIEAGVDLDFEQVYRAMAPLPSLIQAAGRMNRSRRRNRGVMDVFVPDCEGSKYPGGDYERAAMVTMNVSADGLDLSSLEALDKYYDVRYIKDLTPEPLRKAILAKNYALFAKESRMIKSHGVQVVTSYNEKFYRDILSAALDGKVTKKMLAAASSYVVQTYDRLSAESCCVEIVLYNRHTGSETHTGTYVLLDEFKDKCYNTKTGLLLGEANNAIIL